MMPYQQSISVRYAVIFITIRHDTRLYTIRVQHIKKIMINYLLIH
jgi:hypothetical protein